MPGLGQMGEQRIVTVVLGVMRVEAACGPRHLGPGANHGAVEVDGQPAKAELCDLLVEQCAVEPRQRAQRTLREPLEPVAHGAVAGNPAQSAESSENESWAR